MQKRKGFASLVVRRLRQSSRARTSRGTRPSSPTSRPRLGLLLEPQPAAALAQRGLLAEDWKTPRHEKLKLLQGAASPTSARPSSKPPTPAPTAAAAAVAAAASEAAHLQRAQGHAADYAEKPPPPPPPPARPRRRRPGSGRSCASTGTRTTRLRRAGTDGLVCADGAAAAGVGGAAATPLRRTRLDVGGRHGTDRQRLVCVDKYKKTERGVEFGQSAQLAPPLAEVPTGAPARAVATRRAHSRHRAARAPPLVLEQEWRARGCSGARPGAPVAPTARARLAARAPCEYDVFVLAQPQVQLARSEYAAARARGAPATQRGVAVACRNEVTRDESVTRWKRAAARACARPTRRRLGPMRRRRLRRLRLRHRHRRCAPPSPPRRRRRHDRPSLTQRPTTTCQYLPLGGRPAGWR